MYNSYNYNAPASQSTGGPDEAPLIGLLKHLNKDELSDLHENETKVLEMVCDNSQIKAMRTNKETIEASIKSLAEYNMNQKPQIEEKRENLKSLHKELNNVREQYDLARVKYDSVGNVSREDILALLQASLAEVEEQSEATATAFLAGNIDCDSFLAQFRRERKLAHQRRVRTEKMTELAVNAPQSIRPVQPATSAVTAATIVNPSMAMPTAGPPPLPPRNYTVGGPAPYAPVSHEPAPAPTSVFPTRPPPIGNYWGQPSMPMPQPYGGAAPGMYGAAGGGYNHYFNQQRM